MSNANDEARTLLEMMGHDDRMPRGEARDWIVAQHRLDVAAIRWAARQAEVADQHLKLDGSPEHRALWGRNGK